MPFKPQQLRKILFLHGTKWITWKDRADIEKRAHDLSGRRPYPLIVQLKELKTGELLLEQEWKNVWDKKSAPEIMTNEDWDLPVVFAVADFLGAGNPFTEEYHADSLKVPALADSGRQMMIDEILEDE